jgi:putative acetyltransferase
MTFEEGMRSGLKPDEGSDAENEIGFANGCCMEHTVKVVVRRATVADADEMAAAHLDSIRSIGALYYDGPIVSDWSAHVKGDLYVHAMARGEAFYIAVRELPGQPAVMGFSSHRVDANEHRTAVYVRGQAARLGIGSALFRSAEAGAITAGATGIQVDASLAAVEFYKANGFEEVGRGEHRLSSGRSMPCVFMRKNLVVIDALSSYPPSRTV